MGIGNVTSYEACLSSAGVSLAPGSVSMTEVCAIFRNPRRTKIMATTHNDDTTSSAAAATPRAALLSELGRLRTTLSKQCADLIDLDDKHTRAQAELVDTRLERNKFSKHVAELKEELAALREDPAADVRPDRELVRIRQYFRTLSEAELRTQITSRAAASGRQQLQGLSKEALVERLVACCHKRPRAPTTRSSQIMAMLGENTWAIGPIAAIALVLLRALARRVGELQHGRESHWVCSTLWHGVEFLCPEPANYKV